MSEKYLLGYLGIIFPYEFELWQYKSIIKKLCEGFSQQTIDLQFETLLEKNILLVDNNRVRVYPDKIDTVYSEFNSLSEYKRQFIVSKIYQEITNIFRTSKWKNVVDIYLSFVEAKTFDTYLSIDDSSFVNLEKIVYTALLRENMNDIIKIFSSPFIDDVFRAELIPLFYQYNQNKNVIYLYKNIKDKKSLQPDTLIKIASAYFMTSNPNEGQNIIDGLKKNHSKNKNIQTTIKALELINEFESDKGKTKRSILIDEFSKMVKEIEKTPNCANLLLKISSSILPHEDAINFMIKSNLNYNIIQIYNNIGALYLTVGYKKIINNSKDKNDLIKAEKYLQFAKIMAEEKGKYSPYLMLNIQTLRFCKEFRRKSKKCYSAIYKNYINLLGKADSIYFNSIIYCNCYILEKLTSNREYKLEEYRSILNQTYNATQDFKVKEKITDFLNFSIETNKLPLWIITETHY